MKNNNMNKKYRLVLFAALVLFLVSSVPASAKDEGENDWRKLVPQVEGIYDVPNHPDLKVQVLIHEKKERSSKDEFSALICTADPDSTAIVSKAAWRIPSGSWNYVVAGSGIPATISEADVASMVKTSFLQWSNAINSKVVFSGTTSPAVVKTGYDKINMIGWGATPSNALGVTYITYARTGYALDLDTVMSNSVAWSYWSGDENICPNPLAYDAQDIFTHEFGHWLGLKDHYTSKYVNATMYGYGSKGEIKKDTLSTGDIKGVKAVYGIR